MLRNARLVRVIQQDGSSKATAPCTCWDADVNPNPAPGDQDVRISPAVCCQCPWDAYLSHSRHVCTGSGALPSQGSRKSSRSTDEHGVPSGIVLEVLNSDSNASSSNKLVCSPRSCTCTHMCRRLTCIVNSLPLPKVLLSVLILSRDYASSECCALKIQWQRCCLYRMCRLDEQISRHITQRCQKLGFGAGPAGADSNLDALGVL